VREERFGALLSVATRGHARGDVVAEADLHGACRDARGRRGPRDEAGGAAVVVAAATDAHAVTRLHQTAAGRLHAATHKILASESWNCEATQCCRWLLESDATRKVVQGRLDQLEQEAQEKLKPMVAERAERQTKAFQRTIPNTNFKMYVPPRYAPAGTPGAKRQRPETAGAMIGFPTGAYYT
jgi:hypothetical protein